MRLTKSIVIIYNLGLMSNTNNQSNMLNSEFRPKQNINISLEQLKENLPRTPYDHATWLEDFYQKEK